MSKIVLVVAAHPDDEALGCSGVLARHIAEGDQVHVLFMTNGVGSRDDGQNNVTKRRESAKKAADIIGVKSLKFCDYPDNKMDSVPVLDVIKEIESVIDSVRPEIIYTHHYGDLNIDHRITNQAVMTACRPQPDGYINEIYAFEVLSSTEWQSPGLHCFTPTVFVDITKYIDIKKKVLNSYGEEMRKPPHSRSIENAIRLNQLRGNTVGLEYAEAFELLRKVTTRRSFV